MVTLSHTVFLMLSYFHPESISKAEQEPNLHPLGRWEWTHNPHHLALAKINDGATCCIPWDHIQAVATFRQTPVSRSTSVPETSVAFPIPTSQITSTFCVLSAVGLITWHLMGLRQLTQLNLELEAVMPGIAPSPNPPMYLHRVLAVQIT